jgi:hypothetical protein
MSLATQLRADWPDIVEFASCHTALAALAKGRKPAVMVTEPPSGILTKFEFFEQAMDFAPRALVIFTPQAVRAETLPRGARAFGHPLEAARLSGFIRLLVAAPALTSTLSANSSPSPLPCSAGAQQAQSPL